jgi:hypothetical protein
MPPTWEAERLRRYVGTRRQFGDKTLLAVAALARNRMLRRELTARARSCRESHKALKKGSCPRERLERPVPQGCHAGTAVIQNDIICSAYPLRARMLFPHAYAQTAASGGGDFFVSFIPLLIFSIPLSLVAYLSAKRLGSSPVLWAILSLIPFINFFMPLYIVYRFGSAILDRLDSIAQEIKY